MTGLVQKNLYWMNFSITLTISSQSSPLPSGGFDSICHLKLLILWAGGPGWTHSVLIINLLYLLQNNSKNWR